MPGLFRFGEGVKPSDNIRSLSCEPRCPYEQQQPSPGDDGSNGLRDARTGRCETFGGDRRCHGGHCAQVHDTDGEEDRGQAGTTADAVETEAHAVSQRRAGVPVGNGLPGRGAPRQHPR